jgi:hypothetical protein
MKFKAERSFKEYADQVRRRGREFVTAVQEANPEIVLLLVLAHSYVNRLPRAAERLAEIEYGLMPAFVNGLLEAAGPKVRIIDGCEQAYGYLTAEDHFRGYHASRQQALDLVPPELHAAYRSRMEAGVAVYVNYVLALEGAAVGPPTYLSLEDRLRLFEHNIYYALTTADEYAWCYGERIGWWEKGYPVPLPDGALPAIRAARGKHERREPLGFDMAAPIAKAREAELRARTNPK